MQIKLNCCIPFKTYINQSLDQCSGIERKSQIIFISVQQQIRCCFLPRTDLKTIGEMKNAHDISMCVPHSVYLGGIFCTIILYDLERHPY